ncbi:protein PET100 homolog, mitochondrial isoform X1 [Nycticebus coucang]|uniref:protein PET100 homolog, mitochondrial isoform X1 n=1 Tax=Nycticebus coucang TaxID=9470 RepID=UPI00234CB4C7|nr:protein PET100 homolog, mitochondrial isoform X1 [Nycticebus coucang]
MGVKLEVFRMALYLTFPVTMFWISNQAEWFEDYIILRKRELWPPEKEGQVSDILFFPLVEWRKLDSCGCREFQMKLLPVAMNRELRAEEHLVSLLPSP